MKSNEETVGTILGTYKKGGRKFYTILCVCGDSYTRRADYKPHYNLLCCNCLLEIAHSTNIRKHRLYKLHDNIKSRCYNRNTPNYEYYGGKGIVMCDTWREDYTNFYTWALANGYADALSIDRIDFEGNYSPENCRWVAQTVQAQNTRLLRKNNTSGYRGVCKEGNGFTARIDCNYERVNLGKYPTAILAAKAYNDYVGTKGSYHPLNIIEGQDEICTIN